MGTKGKTLRENCGDYSSAASMLHFLFLVLEIFGVDAVLRRMHSF